MVYRKMEEIDIDNWDILYNDNGFYYVYIFLK